MKPKPKLKCVTSVSYKLSWFVSFLSTEALQYLTQLQAVKTNVRYKEVTAGGHQGQVSWKNRSIGRVQTPMPLSWIMDETTLFAMVGSVDRIYPNAPTTTTIKYIYELYAQTPFPTFSYRWQRFKGQNDLEFTQLHMKNFERVLIMINMCFPQATIENYLKLEWLVISTRV